MVKPNVRKYILYKNSIYTGKPRRPFVSHQVQLGSNEMWVRHDIGRSVYHFLQYIYTFRDTRCCSTDCLLMHRCQLYMFRTITVHPQQLLFRCCMCRLWYVLIRPAGRTFEEELFLKRCTSRTYQIVWFL